MRKLICGIYDNAGTKTVVELKCDAEGRLVTSGGVSGDVLSTLLTGFSLDGYEVAAITSADSILTAIEQLEYCTLINNAKATGADRVLKAGDTVTGPLNVTNVLNVNQFEMNEDALVYAATTDLPFTGNGWKTLVLTGNVAFTTSSRAARREMNVKITGGASIRTFTSWPAWTWIGGAPPGSLAANKTAVLSLRCFGVNDTDILASYGVQV